MPWEYRGNNRYWYDARKVDGRVVKEYIGDGVFGQLAAYNAADAREQREAKRQAAKSDLAALQMEKDAATPVLAFYEAVQALVGDVLTAAGYHRPQRGPWRRRRSRNEEGKVVEEMQEIRETDENTSGELVPSMPAVASESASAQEEAAAAWIDVLSRTSKGETAALPELRRQIAENPRLADRWLSSNHTARSAEGALLDLACGKNYFARELWQREAGQIRASLSGPAPALVPPLESLLIERIVICYMELKHYTGSYARQKQQKGGMSRAVEDAKQKRIDRAHRRYLSAIKALADVRRMNLPPIQVNIAAPGGQQVNLSSGKQAV